MAQKTFCDKCGLEIVASNSALNNSTVSFSPQVQGNGVKVTISAESNDEFNDFEFCRECIIAIVGKCIEAAK